MVVAVEALPGYECSAGLADMGGVGGVRAGVPFRGKMGATSQSIAHRCNDRKKRHTDRSGRAFLASTSLDQPVSAQRVLARECFPTLVASKRLDTEVDALVSLQVVIAVLLVSYALSAILPSSHTKL